MHSSISSLLIIIFHLLARDVRLQAFVEVVRTYAGIDDCCDNQNNGENSEGCQLFPRWSISLLPSY